jgi:GT2 family glycosyltransferase
MKKQTSVIIPNWRGRKLLEKNLPAVLATNPDEVIVVDDASPDDSNKLLKKNYPEIKIIRHSKNLGFSSACNSGAKAATGEIVILLNPDVVPEKNALKKILPDFKDEKVFAVSFNEPDWSWAKISWKKGTIEHEPGPKSKKAHVSAWASGGSAAFRKTIWEKLGGFDEIYKPFYWEDIDLSYRAWKRGYQVLWEPKAIVHHKHGAIIDKHFSKKYINFISERNRLLFIWKNITDPKMMIEHKLFLLLQLIKPGYLKPFMAAKVKYPQLIPRRFKEWHGKKIPDREIFKQFTTSDVV